MDNWRERVQSVAKSYSTYGIVAGILMLVIGFITLFSPAASLTAILWLIVIGFLVAGIFRISAYNKMPYMLRQGFSLTTGIIDIVCSVLMIICMISNPDATDTVFVLFMGYMFAFYAIFAGINSISESGLVGRLGGSRGWLIFSGVLELIAGTLLMFMPQVGTLFLMYMLGFVFISGGISLIATSLDLRNRAKSMNEAADRLDDDFDPDNPWGLFR